MNYVQDIWYRTKDTSDFISLLDKLGLSTESIRRIFEIWLWQSEQMLLSKSFHFALTKAKVKKQEKENIEKALLGYRLIKGTIFTKEEILEKINPGEWHSEWPPHLYELHIAAYNLLVSQEEPDIKLMGWLLGFMNYNVIQCRKTKSYILENDNCEAHWIQCEPQIFP